MNDTAKTEATTVVRPAIRNIAKMTDAHLIKVLTDNGVSVPDGALRVQLVNLAREAGLWNYSGNIVPVGFKQKYKANGGTNGDIVAHAMTDLEEPALIAIATANSLDYGRWAHLNFGQRRMNLGNVLRGMIRRGESVVIGLHEWDKGELISAPVAEEQAPEPEEPVAEAPSEE